MASSTPKHRRDAPSTQTRASRHDAQRTRTDSATADRAVSALTIGLIAVAALAVIGLLALWPRGDTPHVEVAPRTYVDATIRGADEGPCPGIDPEVELPDCHIYDAELTSGDDAGSIVTFFVQPTQTDVPELSAGDDVVLLHNPESTEGFQYAFEDYQRATPMLWLLVAFIVVVIAFGRWLGVRALAGLGLSLVVVVVFIVPAMLRDTPELMVALVGAAVVAYLAIYLAHGFGMFSSIALAGTLVSLALTAVLALVAASLTQLSGLSSEETQVLRVTVDALNLRGLLVAGIVIGTLGVLDDVTVSQVSTVAALRRANPDLSRRVLYAEAIRVGRDHIAAAVNTLVLAYAGASLPLLMFFAQGDLPFTRLITGELVAMEVVRMLVGSIGLILSVPITTALAALILSNAATMPADVHGHAHGYPHPPAPAAVPPPPEPAPSSVPWPGPTDDGSPAGWPPPPGPAPSRDDRPPEPWF
jgi:uncharacterized membrane protein